MLRRVEEHPSRRFAMAAELSTSREIGNSRRNKLSRNICEPKMILVEEISVSSSTGDSLSAAMSASWKILAVMTWAVAAAGNPACLVFELADMQEGMTQAAMSHDTSLFRRLVLGWIEADFRVQGRIF